MTAAAIAVPTAVPLREVSGTWTLTSGLIHGADETLGTTRLFRTKGWIVDGRRMQMPVVSGNGIRGLWRRACALAFLDCYLDAGGAPLSLSAFYYLTSGGSLKKGSATGAIRLGEERLLRTLIPHVGLFGGAGLGRIQPGKLWINDAAPICRETVPLLRLIAPEVETAPTAAMSIREMTEVAGYSRHDDAKAEVYAKYLSADGQQDRDRRLARGETSDEAPDAGQAQQMRYEQMEMVAGTVLFHRWGFVWPPLRDEMAGFAAGILRWAEHAHAGGRQSVGHGNLVPSYEPMAVETRLLTDGRPALDVLREGSPIEVIRAHVRDHRDAITEVLARL